MQNALLKQDTAVDHFADLSHELSNIINVDMLSTLTMFQSYKMIRSTPDGTLKQVVHYTSGYGEENSQFQDALVDVLPHHIGSGCFADVFECPWDESKVIKIGAGEGYNGDIYSDGWLNYAAFSMSNNFKYIIPPVHKLDIHDCFFVALLDKYDVTECQYNWGPVEETKLINRRLKTIREVLIRQHKFDGRKHDKDYGAEIRIMLESDTLRINDTHDDNIMINLDTQHVFLIDPDSRSSTEATDDILTALGC